MRATKDAMAYERRTDDASASKVTDTQPRNDPSDLGPQRSLNSAGPMGCGDPTSCGDPWAAKVQRAATIPFDATKLRAATTLWPATTPGIAAIP